MIRAFSLALAIIAMAALPMRDATARSSLQKAPRLDARSCMVLALYHEARSESRRALLMHGYTIAWRVKRDDFPNSVCRVVFHRGAFSAFNKGIPKMRNKALRKRVEKIADEVLTKAFPDRFGGSKCVKRDIHTRACIATKADTIRMPIGVATHYAVVDCYYLGRANYEYVKTAAGKCVPRWSVKMKQVASVQCKLVKNRPCRIVFWRKR